MDNNVKEFCRVCGVILYEHEHDVCDACIFSMCEEED